MIEWLGESWLFNTPEGWLVVITGALALATGALAFVTYKTAVRAKDAANAAVRSAEIAEQDLRRRSTAIILPFGHSSLKNDGSFRTPLVVTLRNISAQTAFRPSLYISYHGRGNIEDDWIEQGKIERNWQEFIGLEEGMPLLIEPADQQDFPFSPPPDVVEAQERGDIHVTHVAVAVHYSDLALFSRYESSSELRLESADYFWHSLTIDGETHWL